MPALHGFIVLFPFVTPTIGLSKSASPKPTARSIARFGERAMPPVMMRERRLAAIADPPGKNGENAIAMIARSSERLKVILITPAARAGRDSHCPRRPNPFRRDLASNLLPSYK